MRVIFLISVFLFSFLVHAAEKQVASVKIISMSEAAAPAKAIAIPAGTAAVPIIPVIVPSLVSVSESLVVKDPSLVPPIWFQDLIISAEGLPTIGPIVVKALQWGSILITLLTAICGCFIVICKSLSGIANFSNLSNLAQSVETFENGKIMYYLKFLSAFNAQKPLPPIEKG